MRDCQNAKVRDQLPDLLHGRLTGDARAEVEAHVASCAECRAEFELLRQVQAATSNAPRIDAARVIAQVPAYRKRSAWSAASRSWPLRAAAGFVLLVGAATLVRGRGDVADEADTLLASAQTSDIAVGALTDLEDQDLKALVTELKKLKAVTPVEPEVVVPAVGRPGSSGGGQ